VFDAVAGVVTAAVVQSRRRTDHVGPLRQNVGPYATPFPFELAAHRRAFDESPLTARGQRTDPDRLRRPGRNCSQFAASRFSYLASDLDASG